MIGHVPVRVQHVLGHGACFTWVQSVQGGVGLASLRAACRIPTTRSRRSVIVILFVMAHSAAMLMTVRPRPSGFGLRLSLAAAWTVAPLLLPGFCLEACGLVRIADMQGVVSLLRGLERA